MIERLLEDVTTQTSALAQCVQTEYVVFARDTLRRLEILFLFGSPTPADVVDCIEALAKFEEVLPSPAEGWE